MLKQYKGKLLLLLTASSLLWAGCSLNHYKNAAHCHYSLVQTPTNNQPLNGIYLGNQSIDPGNPLANSLILLGMLSSHDDYPLTLGLNLLVKNPNRSAARIDKLDVAFFVDRDGNGKFSPNEQIDLRLFLNYKPNQIAQSLDKYLSTQSSKTIKFTIDPNSQKELPVVLLLPNIKQQMREHGLMTSLFAAALKGDMSRLSLRIRPYIGQVAMPQWINIDLNLLNTEYTEIHR